MEGADAERTFVVGHFDLDRNHHANNVRYVTWGLEAFPPELHTQLRPRRIEVRYRAECGLGDEIRARSTPLSEPVSTEGAAHVRCHLIELSDGTELARMRTVWIPCA